MDTVQTASGKIDLLFVRGPSPLSRFIMWGLEEPASHMAIDLEAEMKIIHSDLTGLHVTKRPDFFQDHWTVARFRLLLTAKAELLITTKLDRLVQSENVPYDYGAFMSLAWAGFRQRLFTAPRPIHSLWGDDSKFLCSEVAYLINQLVVEQTGKALFDYSVDLGALSPWALFELLQKTHGGKNEADFRPTASFSAA